MPSTQKRNIMVSNKRLDVIAIELLISCHGLDLYCLEETKVLNRTETEEAIKDLVAHNLSSLLLSICIMSTVMILFKFIELSLSTV